MPPDVIVGVVWRSRETWLADLQVIVVVIEVEHELVSAIDDDAEHARAFERLIDDGERTRVPVADRRQRTTLLERCDLGEVLLFSPRQSPALPAPELLDLLLAELGVAQLRDRTRVREEPALGVRDAAPRRRRDLRETVTIMRARGGRVRC